jgi:ABC-2 type transport system permease protein
MPGAFVIAGKDIRLRIRDRSAIVLAFVAPLAIASLMSFAFRGADSFHMTIAVADADHGPVAAAMLTALDSPDLRSIMTVHHVADADAARRAVDNRDVAAAIVIPPGFSNATTSTTATSLPVYTSTNEELAGSITRSIASSFVAQVNADRLSVATALAAPGATRLDPAQLAARVANLSIPEQVVSKPVGAKPLKAISYYGPAMAIFFLFFSIGFAARSFLSERTDGMLDRIAAAPVRPAEIILGKVLAVVVFGLASMATLLIATSIFFGADWGDPLSVALLSIAIVLAIGALSALLMTLGRTDRQVAGYAAIITFGLALLGGNFISLAQSGPLLRKLALLTPNGWALRGFVDQTTGAAGLSHALEPIGAILLITVVIAVVAAIRARDLVIR